MNHFVWVDLSTFAPESAKRFYRDVFGWDYEDDGSGYLVGGLGNKQTAGLYEMPAFFKKINMPSFWMTYIRVADITQTLERAKALGAKIELEEDNRLGRVALIRDPAGAGFTCIQGDRLPAAQDARSAGRWCFSELMVSDLGKVEPFYTGVFGWTFREASDDRYDILDPAGQRIGSVQVAPNEIKGDKEFWAVYFRVGDLGQTRQAIEHAGGEVIYEHANTDGQHLLARDDQGAAFFVTQSDTAASGPGAGTSDSLRASGNPAGWDIPGAGAGVWGLKWRSLIGLVGIYLIVLFEQDWAWGLLFLYWVLPDLWRGTTYFIEPVSRRKNPLQYWAIVLTWLWMSAYLLLAAVL